MAKLKNSLMLLQKRTFEAQGPRSHILMTGGGEGGPSVFFGSKILAKSDFFGSMKDAGIFWGRKKKRDFLGLRKKG